MRDSASPVIRVFLIDNHEMVLAGLSALIQKEPGLVVVGQASNRIEALEARRYDPDVILLDLALGGENNLHFLSNLLQAVAPARVLVVTDLPDPELHLRAVRLGAMGILSKVESPNLLFKAIRKVNSGEVWLSRSMVASVILQQSAMKADPEEAKIATLTCRERDVIALLGEGQKNKQIAEHLFISEKTVGHYLSSIFAKLNVSGRLELVIYSYRHHLAKPAPPSCNLIYKHPVFFGRLFRNSHRIIPNSLNSRSSEKNPRKGRFFP
jgi:DNA-binding NarL/FixJ family response regulator